MYGGFPPAPARRRNAPPVQGGGDLPKRLRAGGLSLGDDRRDSGGEGVSPGRAGGVDGGAGLGQAWVAEGLPTGLGGGQGGLVRSLMILRSRSARAAKRCSVNGSTSAPSSATRKGTRCAIKPETKWTSWLSRSSLATATGHVFPLRRVLGEGLGQIRAALEGVRALAGLNFSELGDDLEPLGLGEPGDGGALGVDAKPRAALLAGADPVVGDERLRHDGRRPVHP